jgi:hypothetical protein
MSTTKVTTDVKEIQRWAEARGGKPVHVKTTGRGKDDLGILRIDFPGYSGGDKLEPVSWDEWGEAFHEKQLALLYQDKTADGERSNFNKLVSRETAQAEHKKHAS